MRGQEGARGSKREQEREGVGERGEGERRRGRKREREREMRTQNKGQKKKNVVRNHSAIANFEDGGKAATNQGKGKKWILP